MFFKKKEPILLAVCTGESLPLERIPDEVFSTGILGKGVAIEPSNGAIYSPVDGRIETVAEAGHAYTLLSDDGLSLLIHVGVDTVSLNGKPFSLKVTSGQKVRAGQLLAEADLDAIREKGLSAMTALVVTEPQKLSSLTFVYQKVDGGHTRIATYEIRR